MFNVIKRRIRYGVSLKLRSSYANVPKMEKGLTELNRKFPYIVIRVYIYKMLMYIFIFIYIYIIAKQL